MKPKPFVRFPLLVLTATLAFASAAQAAGYETPTTRGKPVLTTCNPKNQTSSTTCRVTSLPGVAGYTLVASRSGPIVVNDIRIGTLHEKVWRKTANPKIYIFGAKVQVNAEQWDAGGTSFNVNDVFRRTREKASVSVAYMQDSAKKALLYAGRTAQGLSEYERTQPERDNTWVDFRVDVNADDSDGVNSPASPWLLLRTCARKGIELDPFGIRLLNSETSDPSESVEIFLPGYMPVGVPIGDDDDDDDDDEE